MFWSPLSKIVAAWVYFCVSCSVPLVLCLFLCQYHAVFIAFALKYSLKSGSVIFSTLFFLLWIVLTTCDLFAVPYKL
jgi:hypothetical protein